MTDMNQPGAMSAIERARLSAELLQIRGQLVANELSTIEKARASARALVIRAQLGAPKNIPDEGQAAFEAARTYYQENLKGRVIKSVIGPVQVNGTGWKKAKQGMKSDLLKAKLIEFVREILESGVAGARQAPHKPRVDGFVAFYFIQKQVQVGDLLVTAGVTVAEDEKGNLFYNVSHEGRDSWKAKENGVSDYVGVGPHSENAADPLLDAAQRAPEASGVENTVADDDLNITILAVVAVEQAGPAANEPAPVQPVAAAGVVPMVTGTEPQKNGGVLVLGDPGALAAYAKAYLDQAKFTTVATGLMLTKNQARLADYLPATRETLPSGADIYRYEKLSGVAVAAGGELSGIARNLPELKSLMAQEWGPDKYRAVFGEEAGAEDVQAYQDEQAAIASRRQAAAAEAQQAQADQLKAVEQEQAREKAEAEETVKLLAQQEAEKRADFERTIGSGQADNPIYQAYLDTLEQLPTYEAGNAGFLGWAGIRAGEFERLGKGRISSNKDAYLAYVRSWADEHLADRVKAASRDTAAAVDGADEYAAKAVGFKTFTEYAASRIDKLPLESFQVARAKYKIIEHLEQVGRSDRNTLNGLSLQGANATGPSALAQLRQDGYLLNNLRAASNPFSLAPGVTLASFVAGKAPEEEAAPPKAVSAHAAESPAAPQIIEYKTKRDKILRGIIRTDLTYAEAKAIDPYTWRMNGGYFIREKHLEGDTSNIQAAPAPVLLTPEQEAEKQERDARAALERQQKAVASQAAKLREAGEKAIAGGQQGMTADRKTNTSRRAGMAASAFARAANDEAEGRTLTSIADAIEVGAAGALSGLTSRTQLQELKRALSRAKSESEKGLSYSEQLQRQGEPVGEEVIHLVRMPSRMVWANRFQNAAEEIAKKAPTGNSKLIAALRKMGQRVERWSLEKDADIAITRKAYQVLKGVKDTWYLNDPMEMLGKFERLKRMGITTDAQLQDACRALLPHLAAKKEESAVAKAERAIIGQKVGIDFFPTPAHIAQRMAKLARIGKGDRVLEPSAGNGNLADAAAAAGGQLDVIEISSQLRDILTAKGYAVVDHDFMAFTPEQPYQAILMNPPFSKRQDAEHIMRAFGMLAGGGSLVAIAGEGVFIGSDQKAQQFRAWLDQHGAVVEKLDGGTFQDNALLAQTSANARLIVLRK